MHGEVLDWVKYSINRWRPNASGLSVIELGSLDINGSVRSIAQPLASFYVGVDVQSGKGVDIVANAATFVHPTVDLVLCCEVFEHTPEWRKIILNAYSLLNQGGLFVATMAGEGRSPHSAIDENPIRDWEYYDNVGAWELNRIMKTFAFHDVNTQNFDIRCWGIK